MKKNQEKDAAVLPVMIPGSMWKISGATGTKTYDEGEMTQTDALDEFLIRIHNETFAVSGMIFQDAWNLDLDRLKRCYICEVDPDHGMVPFCAYNLTNLKGTYLYRK